MFNINLFFKKDKYKFCNNIIGIFTFKIKINKDNFKNIKITNFFEKILFI